MDIALCQNETCEVKETCKRWMLRHKADPKWQSYVLHTGNMGKLCPDYWEMTERKVEK